MPQSILESTVDLAMAQIRRQAIVAEDLVPLLAATHSNLMRLSLSEQQGQPAAEASQAPTLGWRKSIRADRITCLECGKELRQLTNSHLQTHGLNAASYRQRYGIPQMQPLSSKRTARRRREVVQQVRPWEAAARKGQG
jgi:predicted transcriptional regulator